MKILLFGKSGQLGRALMQPLASLGELVSMDRNSEDLCGDLSNLTGLAQAVRVIQPDVIVNAAAFTDVDLAEQEPLRARTINAIAPGVLAEEAARQGALLIHFSTDYVFDGIGTRPWSESDKTNPLNAYGTSKRDGERMIALSEAQHLILRTSWLHSEFGGNFPRTMLKLGAERESLSVVDDQIGVPTDAAMLATLVAALIPIVKNQASLSGIYHCVPTGETSWYQYAAFVFEEARKRGIPLRLNNLQPMSSADYGGPAKRPLNSRLDTSKLRATFGFQLPDWRSGVSRVLDELVETSSRNQHP